MRLEKLTALSRLLYTQWFARSSGPLAEIAGPGARRDQGAEPSFVTRLRAAHAGTQRYEPGWLARAVGPFGAVAVERSAVRLDLRPPDYANLTRPAAPVRIGDVLAVTSRRDAVDASSGWWLAFGSAGPAPADQMARVYWNSGTDAVASLIEGVTGLLEARRVPYTMKCPSEPELFGRVDGVVLYLGTGVFAAAKSELRELHARLASRLGEGVPPLTLRLGRGVAVAEDPASDESFGQSRARAVADGLLHAADAGLTNEDDVIGMIVDRLVANGISAARPYLSVASPPESVTGW